MAKYAADTNVSIEKSMMEIRQTVVSRYGATDFTVRERARAAGVPFFFKQWGEWAPLPFGVHVDDEPWCEARYGEFSRGKPFCESCMTAAGVVVYRVGAKLAGHALDGKVWEQMPNAATMKGDEGNDETNYNASIRSIHTASVALSADGYV